MGVKQQHPTNQENHPSYITLKMLYTKVTICSFLMVTALGKSLVKDSNNFDAVCHESEDGYAVFVPHPYDCSLYYECRGRTPVLMSCPAGLYFDSRINVCNWPEYVDCDESTTSTTTTTTTSPTTTETSTNSTKNRIKRSADFDVVCHESEDGYAVFVPHPFDCSLYYECVDLTPVLMSCPAGLYFDSRIDTCNWPRNVDCDDRTTTTTVSSTTTTETSTNSTTTTTSP